MWRILGKFRSATPHRTFDLESIPVQVNAYATKHNPQKLLNVFENVYPVLYLIPRHPTASCRNLGSDGMTTIMQRSFPDILASCKNLGCRRRKYYFLQYSQINFTMVLIFGMKIQNIIIICIKHFHCLQVLFPVDKQHSSICNIINLEFLGS